MNQERPKVSDGAPEIRNQQVVVSSTTAGSNLFDDSAVDCREQGANRGAYLPIALAILVLWLLLHRLAAELWMTWAGAAERLIVGPRA